ICPLHIRPRSATPARRSRMHKPAPDGGEPVLTYELPGTANGRPLLIKGRREGEGPTAGVTLDITGTDLLLEAPMIDALPERFAALGRQFHLANVRGDVAVRFVRQHGSADYARHFLITFKDGALKYEVFPYPLETLRGVLDIAVVPTALVSAEATPPSPDAPPPFGEARRDHCLFRGLEGSHRGARMALSGQYEYRPDGDCM